jgi:hypothetical protein
MTDAPPPLLYHGTRAAFGPGGILLPAEETGAVSNFPEMPPDRRGYVFVTSSLDLAWYFAEHCQGTNKPRVCVVVPHGGLIADWSTVNGEEHESFACEWATVKRCLTRRERMNATA